MQPATYNIKMYRGATWSIDIAAETAMSGDTNFNTAYTDIQIKIIESWVTKPISTELVRFTLSTDNGRITISEDGLTITLLVSAADTAAMTFSSGIYELELINADEDPAVVDIMLIGSVTVSGG